MTQKIFLPIKFPGLNDYISAINRNKYVGNQMKQEYTIAVARFARNKLTPVKKPVLIGFTWHEENTRRDPDNIIFAKKFILDGLVVAGILPTDTQRWIYGFTDVWFSINLKSKSLHLELPLEVGVTITIKETYDKTP